MHAKFLKKIAKAKVLLEDSSVHEWSGVEWIAEETASAAALRPRLSSTDVPMLIICVDILGCDSKPPIMSLFTNKPKIGYRCNSLYGPSTMCQ
jgi:hypothetical protein